AAVDRRTDRSLHQARLHGVSAVRPQVSVRFQSVERLILVAIVIAGRERKSDQGDDVMVREFLGKLWLDRIHHRLGAFPEHPAPTLIRARAPAASRIAASPTWIAAADSGNSKSRNTQPDAPAAAWRAPLSRARTVNRAVIRRHLRAHRLRPGRV